jgi:hypothetical protein
LEPMLARLSASSLLSLPMCVTSHPSKLPLITCYYNCRFFGIPS